LLDASSMLLGSATERSSETAILSRVLDLAFDVLHADGYAVWREFEQGRVWRVVARRGLSDEYRTEMAANGTIPRAVWRVEDVRVDPRLATELTAYEREGIRSMLLVPWMLGDTLSGTIVFYWKTPHRITQDEEDYAVALTNLSASALNRQELQDQSAREKQRLTFLAQASEVLASSLDYEATLKRVAQLAVSEIADWCTVHVVDHGAVTRLAVAHADPAMEYLVQEYAGKYPEVIRPEAGLGMVLATGEPEIYERITDEMVVAVARNEEHLKLLRALGLTSSILVPLIARGKVLGALRLLGAGSGRYFTQDDVHLAQDLARRAAVAIENARLHRAVLEHESELRLSHAAAHMGSWSMDLERDRIFWSDEFKALHGLERETAATYEGGSALVHPEDRDRVLAELKAVLSSDEEFLHFEHRVVTGDGRVAWLQNRGRVKRNEHGKAVTIAGIAIDVTESRLAELALRRTEKLAAAGRLAATVAHEVNNPLESLVNLVYLAQRVDGVPEEAKQHLQIADGELSRMAHIVRQTLGFYRESAIAKDVELCWNAWVAAGA
jgi:PAS domain S-box-containing protein